MEPGVVRDAEELEISLRQIIEEEIVARFGRLSEADVWRKADGDLVTRADLAAEQRIGNLLRRVKPASVVIGEEAVSADPWLASKANGPSVWIVDPLDSTMNFHIGDPNFSTLIAYCEDGIVVGSWTFIPMQGVTAFAARHKGAFVNGKRVTSRVFCPGRLSVSITHPAFRTAPEEDFFAVLADHDLDFVPCRGAGIDYVALVAGEIDACVFTWQKPWDHAAGSVFVTEAGGCHGDYGGNAFDLAGNNYLPLIAASDQALFDRLRARIARQSAQNQHT
jgi:fructose-1,6-bisphosphatase/inositol monophosphatase family enzyme